MLRPLVQRPTLALSFFSHNAQWLRISARSQPLPSVSLYKPVTGRLLDSYLQLSKSKLSVLVVLSAMSGVALSPSPATLPVLLSTALGTALCSASANTLNQLQEIPFDAQMARTRSRPLVRRAISSLHATGFAAVTGIVGPALLWTVNPTTAILGISNIALYAGVYTWMKRKSPLNTWVGSVVGAIPPLMGWTACDAQALSCNFFLCQATSWSYVDISFTVAYPSGDILAPLTLSMLLFSWQFPHFNPLSHLVRGSYAQAGCHMLSVINPSKNALVSLRHALLLVPICCVLAPLSGLTTWTFAITALLPNVICVRAAWRFWRRGGESEAKTLFYHSIWYLPVILGLMMVHKQGMDWSQWMGLSNATSKDELEKDD
ncbi:protoheme IX farnesyltransferase [Amanita rubescens]|nr:protoheme IX farnesyltransferase [Amanita rubescens]